MRVDPVGVCTAGLADDDDSHEADVNDVLPVGQWLCSIS
jgi:hypothetical protein